MSDISEIDELYSPAPESNNGLNYDLIADEPFTFIYEFPPNGHATGSDIPNHNVATLPLKARQKRCAQAIEYSDSENQVSTTVTGKPAKRKRHTRKSKLTKTKAIVAEDDSHHSESEDHADVEPAHEISGHLFLETTSIVPGTRGCPGKATNATSIQVQSSQCPAFLFTTESTFEDLIREIAKAARTTPANITVTRLHWKHETPAKGERKLLSDGVGYKTMLKSIKAKKGNPVIFFYLPKPNQSEEPPTLSTIWDNSGVMEYEELDMAREHDGGMKSQINMLQHGYMVERQKLEDKYPVSNNPLFPGKCIYASKDKTFWELTPICIEVWAAAIAKSRATYDTPPTSTHFIASNTIKPHHPEPGAPLSTFAAYHKFVSGTDEAQPPVVGPGVDSEIPTYHPHPTIFPVAGPAPYSMQPLVYPPPNILHSHYAPTGMPYFPPSYYPPFPYQMHLLVPTPNTALNRVDPPSAMSSPGTTTSHNVTLGEFCTKYSISTKDAERLAEIEYAPGNKLVEGLSEADRKEAGFSILGWRGFLLAHGKFCRAICDGSWAAGKEEAWFWTMILV